MKGRVRAARGQRHVQADDIAFPQNLLEIDEIPARVIALGQRRIADEAVDAERIELAIKPRTDIAETDDAGAPAQRIEVLLP